MFEKLLNKWALSRVKPDIDSAVENALIEHSKWHSVESERPSMNRRFSAEDTALVYEIQNVDGGFNKFFTKIKNSKVSKRIAEVTGWTFLGTNYSEDPDRYQAQEDLFDIQDSAFIKYYQDPHMKNIVDNIQFFTIGRGMRFEAIAPVVQDRLAEFWQRNRMNSRQKDMVKSAFREGEYFIVYFVNPSDGKVTLRKIRAKEINKIETHTQDISTRLSYERYFHNGKVEESRYYLDFNYNKQLQDKFLSEQSAFIDRVQGNQYIQFIKYGEEDEVRGRVPVGNILRYLKLYEDWLFDRARLNHERSKVVWIKKYLNTNPDMKNIQPQRPPKGGMMLIETPNISYEFKNPNINADDAKEDGLSLLYMIGSGVNMPIHVLDQRADEAVYASLKKADTPFSNAIVANQDFWADQFDDMFRFVIRSAMEASANPLPKKIKVPSFSSEKKLEEIQKLVNRMAFDGMSDERIIEEAGKEVKKSKIEDVEINTDDVYISKIFPEIVKEDQLNQAKILAIHDKIGIASLQTLSEKSGYDWKEELYRMQKDRESRPEVYIEKNAQKTPNNFGPRDQTRKDGSQPHDGTTGKE